MDIVVLTALDLEYAAVRAHLTGLRTHTDANGTRYETGQSGAGRCRVALALAGPGNLAAAAVTTRAIARFRPKALILVGVAGGLADGVALGDVVVATRVHAYHGGRADSGGFRPRPKSWPLAHSLEQEARDVARGGAWTNLLPVPAVHFKPVVSGEVVLDTGDGQIATLIKQHYNDAAAIDMESAGVAEAAHHNDFHRTITVRAISDLADGTKRHTDATGWQHRAATHAAAFAIALAERIAAGRGDTRVLTSYRKQVEAIAPEQLLDREDELAELTRFTAGDVPYAWWQAGPWAGKSALMSWFVLHPPEGVDVVSFFVTGRLAAQADSDAFTKELTLQLAALSGEHLPDVLPPDGRQGQLWRLLDDAAHRSRCLLVVIDGLDEDTGPTHGKLSIASLLPPRPPPNVRILVASRPDPRVPDDVLDEDHPLLTCIRRDLPESLHARSMERRAVNELNQYLRGDDLHRDVLGLITASGGGLTRRDLEELTGRPPYEIDGLLDGPFGRTIGSRPAPLRPEANAPVHLFAHETLAQAARTKFGASVRHYRDRLHTWADSYRDKGWPPDTPQHLLLGYPHVLADAGDHDRLVAVATDRTRHDRMLHASGGDALAASEVRLAQDVLCRQPAPNLSALLLLAAHNDGLAERNSDIPVRLPVVWMMLGDTARAEALARGITHHESQVLSYLELARFAAGTGDRDRLHAFVTEARTLMRGTSSSLACDEAITELTRAVAAAGDLDLAISLAQDISVVNTRESLLADLTATGEDHDLAESQFEVALEDDPLGRARAAIAVVEEAGSGGAVPPSAVLDEAREMVLALSGKDLLVSLARLGRATASVGDQDRAHALFVKSGQLVDQVLDSLTRDQITLKWLLPSAFAAGEYDWASARIDGFTDHDEKAWATAELVKAAARSVDRDRVSSLITDAVTRVQSLPDTNATGFALARAAVAAATIGDHERAQALISDVADGWFLQEALTDLAETAMGDGDLEGALSWVRRIVDENDQNQALAKLAETATIAGAHDRALRLVDLIPDVSERKEALTTLAERATKTGEYERARALASSITDRHHRTRVQRRLGSAATADGAWDQAIAVLNDMADDMDRTALLAELVVAIAAAGDPDRARNVAVEISDPLQLPEVLTRLATAAVSAGDRSRVRALLTEAATIAGARLGPLIRSYVLALAVEVAIAAGERDQAAALARDIVNPYSQISAFTQLAEAAAEAGDHDTARELALRVEVIARNELHAMGPPEFTGLAVAALLIGDRDRAHRLARTITDVDWRVWALEQQALADPESTRALLTDTIADVGSIPHGAERAGALIRLVPVAGTVGQPDLLRSLIAETEDSIAAVVKVEARACLLAFLAKAAAGAGELDAARALFAAAESLAGAVSDPGGQVYSLFDIATTLEFGLDMTIQSALATTAIAIGDLARAQILAGGIADSDKRHEVLTELALAASKAGDQELTVAVVRGIDSALHRHQALEKLIEQAAAAGEHDLARSLALVTPSSHHQAEMLIWLARFATATGDHTRASSLVRAISDTSRRAGGLLWLVRAAVAAGDHERARTLAGELSSNDRQRAESYLSGEIPAIPGLYSDTYRAEPMVDLLIAAGDHESALALAGDNHAYWSHMEFDWADPARAKLVDAEIAAGDHERALATAREITATEDRAAALSRVVEAVAAAGDPERARSLLAEVLVLARWHESVKLVAKVAPDALGPVLDDLETT